MNEKKLTDEEIVKALKICATELVCNQCPYRHKCVESESNDGLLLSALALINRQKSEIERLKEENFVLYRDRFTKKELDDISDCRVKKATTELQKQVDELSKENERLSDLEFTQEHCDLYKENEYLKSCLVLAKQQAVKDTAKEILQELYEYPHEYHEKKILEIARRKGVEV